MPKDRLLPLPLSKKKTLSQKPADCHIDLTE